MNVTLLQLNYLDPKKRAKTEHLSSISIGYIVASNKKKKTNKKSKNNDKNTNKKMRILFYSSGCGATLVNKRFVKHLNMTKSKNTKWTTKAGTFQIPDK